MGCVSRPKQQQITETNQSVGAMHSVAVGRACHSSTRHRGRQAHKLKSKSNGIK